MQQNKQQSSSGGAVSGVGVAATGMTKSKRKRLRKQAAARSPAGVTSAGQTTLSASAGELPQVVEEEMIVIKTKGFLRNEGMYLEEDNQRRSLFDLFFPSDSSTHSSEEDQYDWSRYSRSSRNQGVDMSSEEVEDYLGDCDDLELLMQYINGRLGKKTAHMKAAAAASAKNNNNKASNNKTTPHKKTHKSPKNKKQNDKENDGNEKHNFSKNTQSKGRSPGLIKNRA